MPYAILRFKKCKSGGVTACYAHNECKKEAYKSNPDIDAARKPDNYHLIMPKQTYLREVRRQIAAASCKTRKDSTVMVETLITASPEFMSTLPPPEQWAYFQRALQFMESKIGGDNIIAAVVHTDERTAHMHLSFCPITADKKLSAKNILGNQVQLSSGKLNTTSICQNADRNRSVAYRQWKQVASIYPCGCSRRLNGWINSLTV